MTYESYKGFMNRVLLSPSDELEEHEVRSGLSEYLIEMGVAPDLAATLSSELAEEFRLFRRALIDEPLEFKTETDRERHLLLEAGKRIATSCKRVWLLQRLAAELRRPQT